MGTGLRVLSLLHACPGRITQGTTGECVNLVPFGKIHTKMIAAWDVHLLVASSCTPRNSP